MRWNLSGQIECNKWFLSNKPERGALLITGSCIFYWSVFSAHLFLTPTSGAFYVHFDFLIMLLNSFSLICWIFFLFFNLYHKIWQVCLSVSSPAYTPEKSSTLCPSPSPGAGSSCCGWTLLTLVEWRANCRPVFCMERYCSLNRASPFKLAFNSNKPHWLKLKWMSLHIKLEHFKAFQDQIWSFFK